MSARYKPHGPVKYTKGRGDFFAYGRCPDDHDVTIEVRDVLETRSGHIWHDGCHRVVVTGPQPRPRSKTFIGETAWSDAERYARDAVSDLQQQQGR